MWAWSIRLAALAFLGAGLAIFAVWRLTGDDAWIEIFFRVPGALLLLGLAVAALWLSAAVSRHFSAGEPLRAAWLLIAGAAACDSAGSLCAQVLSAIPKLTGLRAAGLVVSGPCRMALLAAGLFYGLRAYRRAGFPGQLARPDRLLLAAVGLYVLREVWDTAAAVRRGAPVTAVEALMWPVDPLLWLLLAEALLLLRSAQGMGRGRIGRIWRAFSAGVFLLALGDAGLWATTYGYLPWPWSSITWFVWVPAAAAFALAPAYQLEAIYLARPSPSA